MRTTLALALLVGIVSVAGADSLDAIKHPYQLSALATSCDLAGECDIAFPATTATRTLVTHVSCTFLLPSGGYASAVIASHNLGFNNHDALPVFDAGPNVFVPGENFAINSEVYLFIEKGVVPDVIITSNLPMQNASCKIAGYYLE
jgi:hypothetical protein